MIGNLHGMWMDEFFPIMIIIAVVVALCFFFFLPLLLWCAAQCTESTFSSVCKSKTYMNACHPNRVQALSYNSGCFSAIFSCMHKKKTSLETTKEKHFCSSFQQQQQQHSSTAVVVVVTAYSVQRIEKLVPVPTAIYKSAPYTITINLFGFGWTKWCFWCLRAVFSHHFYTAVIEWTTHTRSQTGFKCTPMHTVTATPCIMQCICSKRTQSAWLCICVRQF